MIYSTSQRLRKRQEVDWEEWIDIKKWVTGQEMKIPFLGGVKISDVNNMLTCQSSTNRTRFDKHRLGKTPLVLDLKVKFINNPL